MENYFPQHFIQEPVPVTAPGLVECDEELKASRLFQIPFWEGKKKKVIFKLSGLYQLPKSERAGGSAAWKPQGVWYCRSGVTGVLAPCSGVASGANGHRHPFSFVGQAGICGAGYLRGRQLSHGCSEGMLGERGPSPSSQPEHPCPPCRASGGTQRVFEGGRGGITSSN